MSDSMKILAFLWVVLIAALVYAVMHWPRQARVLDPAAMPGAATVLQPVEEDLSPSTLEDKAGHAEKTASVAINIFAPIFPPPRSAVNASSVPENARSVTPAAAPQFVSPPRPVPELVGLLRFEGGQRAFLALGNEVYVVSAGETFGPQGRFRVVAIAQRKLTLHFAGEKDSFDIPIVVQPVTVLSPSGSRSAFETVAPLPAAVNQGDTGEVIAPEPGKPREEVPFDQVIDE